MSLNDSTLEGDHYNRINANPTKKVYHDFDTVANSIAKDLFNKKPIHRRIYESIRNTIRRKTRIITTRKGQNSGIRKKPNRTGFRK